MASKGTVIFKMRPGGLAKVSADLLRAADSAVLQTALLIEGETKRNIDTAGLRDTGLMVNRVHTEHLKRQTKDSDKLGVDVKPLEAYIGTNVSYAAAHEYGATIPVTAKMRRFFMYMAIEGHKIKAARYKKGATGGNVSDAASRRAERATPEFWWALAHTKKTSFRLKGHLFLTRAFNKNRAKLEQRIAEFMRRGLK